MNANVVALLYLASGVLFIQALRGLSSPATSRQGNFLGMLGMTIAIVTSIALLGDHSATTWLLIILGLAIGGGIGAYIARSIPMTSMPELVAAFHSLVGLAAVFVAGGALYAPTAFGIGTPGNIAGASLLEMSLGVAIGAITFTGSVIAFAKLSGRMSGKPIILPARHAVNLGLAVLIVALIADASRAMRGWIIAGALALSGLATIASAQASSPVLFFAGRFIAVAAAACVLPIALSLLYGVAKRWLATLIMTIMIGSQFGNAIAATTAGVLATAAGWRSAMTTLGGAMLGVAILVALLLAAIPSDQRLAKPSRQRPVYPIGNLLALLGGYALVGMAQQSQISFSTLILAREFGLAISSASLVVTLSGLGAIVASIIGALVADSIARTNRLALVRVPIVAAFLAAAAMALLAFAPDATLSIVAVVLLALAFGGVFAPVYAALRYGVAGRWWATIAALFLLGYGALGSLGPVLTGWLMDMGGRAQAFGALAALLAVSGVLFLAASAGVARETDDDVADVF